MSIADFRNLRTFFIMKFHKNVMKNRLKYGLAKNEINHSFQNPPNKFFFTEYRKTFKNSIFAIKLSNIRFRMQENVDLGHSMHVIHLLHDAGCINTFYMMFFFVIIQTFIRVTSIL